MACDLCRHDIFDPILGRHLAELAKGRVPIALLERCQCLVVGFQMLGPERMLLIESRQQFENGFGIRQSLQSNATTRRIRISSLDACCSIHSATSRSTRMRAPSLLVSASRREARFTTGPKTVTFT